MSDDIRASRLADLWTRHLTGDPLSDEESAQLCDAFGDDEVFRRRVLNDVRLDGAMRATAELQLRERELLTSMEQLVQAAAQSDGFVERLQARLAVEPAMRRATTRRTLIFGAAAAVAAAAAVIAIPRRAPRTVASRSAAAPASKPMGKMVSRAPADRIVVPAGAKRAVVLMGVEDAEVPARQSSTDEPLTTRLTELGFAVEVVPLDERGTTLPASVRQAQVVVLSPTLLAGELSDDLVDLPVPIVALETSAYTRLGLTGPVWRRDLGNNEQRFRTIEIAAPQHPLAAGLSGSPIVLGRPIMLRWAVPSDDAIIVAHYPGGPAHHSAVFAYERGSEMPGGRAPARRVGLFLGNGRVIRSLTPDGWRLFDAAVAWSAADSR
jgi:hypothetical protein